MLYLRPGNSAAGLQLKETKMILTTAALVALGVAALGGTIAIFSVPYLVKQKKEVLIESFGKYVKTQKKPGLHFKLPWPFQTLARAVSMAMVEKKEDLKTKTKDDIFVTLPIKMHLQVIDSNKYHYESVDPEQQVMSRVAATVKQQTSKMEFAALYQARETISDEVRQNVGAEIENLYGVKLVDVIVDEPHAPAEIQSAYNNVKASERAKMAAENTAAANKITVIAEAEARKEALRLDGEGIAAQRAAIFSNYAEQFNALAAKGMTKEQAHEVIMTAMANDTVRDAAKSGNVIITPLASGNDTISQMAAANKALAPKAA